MTFAGCHQLVSIDFVRTCKISAPLWYWIVHQFYIRTRILLQLTLVMVLINQILGFGTPLFSYLTWIVLSIQFGQGFSVISTILHEGLILVLIWLFPRFNLVRVCRFLVKICIAVSDFEHIPIKGSTKKTLLFWNNS